MLHDTCPVLHLTAQTSTHSQWLGLMRAGLPTLLQDQPALMECIVMEARGLDPNSPAPAARRIMDELGLRFVSIENHTPP